MLLFFRFYFVFITVSCDSSFFQFYKQLLTPLICIAALCEREEEGGRENIQELSLIRPWLWKYSKMSKDMTKQIPKNQKLFQFLQGFILRRWLFLLPIFFSFFVEFLPERWNVIVLWSEGMCRNYGFVLEKNVFFDQVGIFRFSHQDMKDILLGMEHLNFLVSKQLVVTCLRSVSVAIDYWGVNASVHNIDYQNIEALKNQTFYLCLSKKYLKFLPFLIVNFNKKYSQIFQ